MAVNINIPGIGTVSATNAATESTLQALLAATRGQNTIIRSNESTIAYQNQLQERSARATSSQLGGIASSANRAGGAVTRFADDVAGGLNDVQMRTYTFGQYLTDLGHATATLADRMIMDSRNLARDPIGSSVRNVNTIIDIVGDGLSAFAGMFSSSGKAITDAASNTADKFGIINKLIKGTADTAKYVNQFLGDQLQITLDSFQEFNRMGTVFTGGMETIRAVTGRAGILLDQFTQGIRSAIDSVRAMGLGTQFSSIAVARGMEQLKDATHAIEITTRNQKGEITSSTAATSTFRESIRRLGYETEDQVALVADFLSLQRAQMTEDEFRAFTRRGIDAQVAQDTLEYAKSLRLIADLTGASASEVAKEARERQLSSLALANLTTEQRDVFGNVSTFFEKSGAGFLNTALNQLIATGGNAVLDESFNVIASKMPELRQLVDTMYANITSGEMSAEEAGKAAAAQYGDITEMLRERMPEFRELIAAGTLGNASNLGPIINFLDTMAGYTRGGTQTITDSTKAIDAMANAPDKLTQSLVKNAEALLATSVSIEQATTSILPGYSSALATINTYMKNFVEFLAEFGGNIGNILAGDFSFFGKYTTGSEIGVTMGQGADSDNNQGGFTSTGEFTGASVTNPDTAIPVADRVLLGDMKSLLAKAGETNRILQQETLKTAQASSDVNTESNAIIQKLDALIAKNNDLLEEARLQTTKLDASARANKAQADTAALANVYTFS